MRRTRVALAAGCVALAVLHAALVWPVHGFMLSDTTGYLANARWLAGVAGTTWQGPASFYHPGWSLLLAPVYLVADSPRTIQVAALVINGALAVAVFPAGWALARRVFRLPDPAALAAGAVAAAYPAVVLLAGYEWAEPLYQLLFVGFVLAVAAAVRRPSAGAAIAVGLLGAGLYAVHPRGLGIVAVAGVFLLVRGRRHRPLLVGLVPLTLVFLVTRLVNRALLSSIYSERSVAVEGDVLGRLTDVGLLGGLVQATIGQLWYLSVASLGLVPLGVLWLATTRRIPRPVAVVTLASAGATLAASALQMSDGTRVDHMVYGRYLEGVVPVLLVAGVAGLFAWRTTLPRLLAVVAGTGALLGVVLVAVRGGDRFTGDVMPLNVTGILAYRHLESQVDVARVTLLALLLTAVVLLLARWRSILGAVLVAVVFAGSAVSVQARVLDPFDDTFASMTRIPETVRSLTNGGAVSYDLGSYDVEAADFYQLELADRGVRFVGAGARATTPLVISGLSWPDGQRAGARLVTVERPDGLYRQGLWVQAGELQDRLVASGRVLPEDPSAPLPPGARRQRVRAEVPTSLAAGTEDVVDVGITHIGEAMGWLPANAVPGIVQGTVRVGARWYGADGTELPGATAELDRVLLPGDRGRAELVLVAPDRPGRYRLAIGARQEGVAWFDDPATFTVDVR